MRDVNLLLGDCRERLKELPDCSVDSVVTDPPYELGFMGKSWDSTGVAYDVTVWRECLRVLKPGGHLLAFGGSRTYHRLAVAIEDAGFQIRDQIMWVYGSGFPKSLNISKAIDKAAGAEREVIGIRTDGMSSTAMKPDKGWNANSMGSVLDITAPATADAEVWDGWGTALKPAHEPIVLARKPLVGTVANNVLVYGVGGINIDGCRVEGKLDGDPHRFAKTDGGWAIAELHNAPVVRAEGRFPANFIHDGSDEVLELFPDTGKSPNTYVRTVDSFTGGENRKIYSAGIGTSAGNESVNYGDSGSAARFFYCAKANKKDRNEGATNHHPTVKPTDLMRYLCRLITPPNGVVLDPFTGSGSTGKAAVLEGFSFIGVEQSEEYIKIAEARIKFVYDSGA